MDDETTRTASATALAVRFDKQADVSRVIADVATLAVSPRGRHHPRELVRAQEYVTARLIEAGWQVRSVPFERRWMIGVTDAGGRRMKLLRWHRPLPSFQPTQQTATAAHIPLHSPEEPSRRRMMQQPLLRHHEDPARASASLALPEARA